MNPQRGLSWWGIARLGLVQTMLGAIIVLTTSTLNRIMVVELALPAMLPGFLVAVHHFVQLARPRIGYGSDLGGRRTPWIIGGMLLLAFSGFLAAAGTVVMGHSIVIGSVVAFIGFFGIGLGSGATGTSLLVLLAKEVEPARKPAAATLVWFMMIAGFAITATVAGKFLDPYSPSRLLQVTGVVSLLAFVSPCLPYGVSSGGLGLNLTLQKAVSIHLSQQSHFGRRYPRFGRRSRREHLPSLSLYPCSPTAFKISFLNLLPGWFLA